MEEMLSEYEGTLIFVSHDRYFVKKLADKLLVFENGSADFYEYGYEQYEQKERSSVQKEPVSEAAPKVKKAYTTPAKEKAKRERALKKAEEKIGILELEIAHLSECLAAPENASDYLKLSELQEALSEKENLLNETLSEWETLAEQV